MSHDKSSKAFHYKGCDCHGTLAIEAQYQRFFELKGDFGYLEELVKKTLSVWASAIRSAHPLTTEPSMLSVRMIFRGLILSSPYIMVVGQGVIFLTIMLLHASNHPFEAHLHITAELPEPRMSRGHFTQPF